MAKLMRLESFVQDVEYERIYISSRPQFICQQASFYVSQGITILTCTVIFGLMASSEPPFTCLAQDVDSDTSSTVQKSFTYAFYGNLLSFVVNAILMPYFDF